MAISAKDVMALREITGTGMMDCKKALIEADGDMDKAVEILREKGLSAAAKKAGRIAAEGIVDSYVSEDGKLGVIVEVNCETDFVAKTDAFHELTKKIAKQIADVNPADVDALMAKIFTKKYQHIISLRLKIFRGYLLNMNTVISDVQRATRIQRRMQRSHR